MDERARGTREEKNLVVKIRNYNFERALVEMQRGQAVTDRDELKAVEHLLIFLATITPRRIILDDLYVHSDDIMCAWGID